MDLKNAELKVRLPAFVTDRLRRKLKALACKEGQTFQDFLEALLEEAVLHREKKP